MVILQNITVFVVVSEEFFTSLLHFEWHFELSGVPIDSYVTMFAFLSWLDLLGVVQAFWIFFLKIFKFDTGLQISLASKNIWKIEELDLPYIYWIPKMHKNPYKHRFIAGSSKCSNKPLSILLTKLLTHIKQGLQKYCETAYSRSGVNQMWILKNSKELLEHLQSPNFNHITSITGKSFDFSTLYTTIPHQNLKADSQLSSGTLLFTKMGIGDTNFWF